MSDPILATLFGLFVGLVTATVMAVWVLPDETPPDAIYTALCNKPFTAKYTSPTIQYGPVFITLDDTDVGWVQIPAQNCVVLRTLTSSNTPSKE